MENFKKELQKRQSLQVMGLTIANTAVIFTRNVEKTTIAAKHIQSLVEGFQLGILVFLSIVSLYLIMRNIWAMRDPARMEKLYIAETDERKLFIMQKSGSVGMNFVIYGLAAGTVVAGNFNDIVFLTLLSVTVFVALVRGSLKLYYRNKY